MAGLLVCAGMVRGDTVDVVSATWTAASGGTGVVLNFSNGSFLDVRWGAVSDITAKSGLGFDGVAPPPAVLPALGSPFLLGTLRHYNNPIPGGSAASSADLAVDVDLTVGGNPIATGPFNFRFHIDETPNVAPCAYPSATPCADSITFENLLSSDTFLVGSDLYTISIVGFADALGGPLVSSFISDEGMSNDAYLYAAITTPIPEPSSIVLLITIGAGIAIPLRRRLKG